MTCRPAKLPNGGTAIVCSPRARRRKCRCGAAADLLCDWKTGEGKTCDAPICRACVEEVGPDKHLCPTHQGDWAKWQRQRGIL